MKKNLKKRDEIYEKIKTAYFILKSTREEYTDFMSGNEITCLWNLEQDLKKYLSSVESNNFYLKEKGK